MSRSPFLKVDTHALLRSQHPMISHVRMKVFFLAFRRPLLPMTTTLEIEANRCWTTSLSSKGRTCCQTEYGQDPHSRNLVRGYLRSCGVTPVSLLRWAIQRFVLRSLLPSDHCHSHFHLQGRYRPTSCQATRESGRRRPIDSCGFHF